MKEQMLQQLVEKTFAKVACPLHGNGLYAELQKAITEAFTMGEKQQSAQERMIPAMAE